MNFLLYIENSAENLQFSLWFRDYVKRFDQLPEREKKLSPEWVPEQAKPRLAPAKTISDADMTAEEKQKANEEVSAAIKGTDFESKAKLTASEVGNNNPFNTPPRTPIGDRESVAPSTVGWNEDSSTLQSGTCTSHGQKSAGAFETANTFQPCKQATKQHRLFVAHRSQSRSSHTEKRFHVSSPPILPVKEPAVSTSPTRSPPNFFALCPSPHIHRRSARSSAPWSGLSAIKHIPISSATQSAMAIALESFSLAVLALLASWAVFFAPSC